MRVLVCGGRTFGEFFYDTPPEAMEGERRRVEGERRLLDETMATVHVDARVSVLIHGGAKGADRLAGEWAKRMMIATEPYPISHAEWRLIGPRAGPIRNQRMIDEGKPDLVLAFPGGRGTADMIRRAEAAGIKVRRI